MSTGIPLLDTILNLALAALGVVAGVLLLLRGHKMIWLFGGLASFLLALFAMDLLNRWIQILDTDWVRAAIVIAVGVVGGITARSNTMLGYGIIGLATGGLIYLWVVNNLLRRDANIGLDFWTTLVIIVTALLIMLMGAIFVIRYDEVALILLSSAVGVILILESLRLNHESELEALLGLGLGLLGVVVQYHNYLNEQRAALATAAESAPEPSTSTST
jgi:hypothetical protein